MVSHSALSAGSWPTWKADPRGFTWKLGHTITREVTLGTARRSEWHSGCSRGKETGLKLADCSPRRQETAQHTIIILIKIIPKQKSYFIMFHASSTTNSLNSTVRFYKWITYSFKNTKIKHPFIPTRTKKYFFLICGRETCPRPWLLCHVIIKHVCVNLLLSNWRILDYN